MLIEYAKKARFHKYVDSEILLKLLFLRNVFFCCFANPWLHPLAVGGRNLMLNILNAMIA